MDKPWQTSRTWPRKVRSDAKKRMLFTWVFAGLWNVIAFPAVFSGAVAEGGFFVLIFPPIGIGLIWFANRQSEQWRRYGKTTLTLDPYPGSIGGHVGGLIDIERGSTVADGLEVTLECIYSYYSGSGKNRSRRFDVKWQAKGPAGVTRRGSGVCVAFRFDVPSALPASEKKRGKYHLWRLRLAADWDGVPLDRTFEIGVFPTAALSRNVTADTSRAGNASARAEVAGALTDPTRAAELRKNHGLSVEQDGDWLQLVLHPGRQKPLAALFGTIGVVFLCVGVAMVDAEFFERLIFVVIGLVGSAIGVYTPFNALDVRISPREIRRVRTWLGIEIDRQQIRPNQLRELEIEQGGSYYVNDKTTIYYRLEGKGSFGRFRIVESIPDQSLVEAIREQVMAFAGLRRTG